MFDPSDVHAETDATTMTLTRLLDAPRELVFEVWTQPEHVAKWWGPFGFTITTYAMEVTPGGTWRFDMHHAEHGDFKNAIVYQEVAKPERLVYLHDGVDDGKEPFHVTVSFEEEGGKTRVTMRVRLASEEALAEAKKFGAVEGGKQTLTRLAEHLAAVAV